jgi:hypothetical protein
MNSRKHLYYISVSDVQTIAKGTLGRNLDNDELSRVTDKLLEKIQWYEPLEEIILSERRNRNSRQQVYH